MKNNLPNFIIIGAMKAATTSAYTYLLQHPDVFMTKVKEPLFFNNYKQENDYFIKGRKGVKNRTLQEYKSLFDNVKNEKAIGEASPAYILNEMAPNLIKELIPDVKIVAILRQPIDRAYSNFLHAKRDKREPIDDFETAFEKEEERIKNNWSPLYYYKSQGYYFHLLSRYYAIFNNANIKVLLFDDFIKNPIACTQEIYKFLEVNPAFIPDTSNIANISGVPTNNIIGKTVSFLRHYRLLPKFHISKILPKWVVQIMFKLAYKKPEPISSVLRKKLTNKYYKEDILELEKLIGKDLSHWL